MVLAEGCEFFRGKADVGGEHIEGAPAKHWRGTHRHLGPRHTDRVAHHAHFSSSFVVQALDEISCGQVRVCKEFRGVEDGATRGASGPEKLHGFVFCV